jgi:uncharacterized membrane protein (DUF485 family)
VTTRTTDAGPQAAIGGAEASYVGSTGLGIAFTLVLAAPVALFFWFAAYSPATLAGSAGSGGPTSVWIVYGVGLILYATLLNGLYVLITDRAAARAAEPGAGPNGIAVSFFVVLVVATEVDPMSRTTDVIPAVRCFDRWQARMRAAAHAA